MKYKVKNSCSLEKFRVCSRKGFTLIELLVVVLIIGILAAVALPQYQKAVFKSKFAVLENTTLTLKKSIQIYFLENGDWPHSLEELNVGFAGQKVSTYCQVNSDIYCCLLYPIKSSTNGQVACGQMDYSFGYKAFFSRDDGTPRNRNSCVEDTNKSFCPFITNTMPSSSKIITPNGFKSIREYSL